MSLEEKYNRKGFTVFELELYATEDGKEPVAEFLDSLDPKMNAKLIGLLELLEEKRNRTEKTVLSSFG